MERDFDQAFLRRLQRRDEAAFTELVRRHQHAVYRLVLRMLGNPQEAEDMAQEVFVAVFRHIDSFRGDSNLSTWLYRVATNHCKNRIKYLHRRRAESSATLDSLGDHDLSAQGAPEHASPAPDQVLQGWRVERRLQEALGELDEEHRLMIVLRDLEGLPYGEIATITGLAEGTVKSRLHRARLALRERIAPWLK